MERAALARALAKWRLPGKEPKPINRVCLADPLPERFMARFAWAVAAPGEIFLGNPAWSDAEQKQVRTLIQAAPPENPGRGWLMIPTGGTSGEIKFARHDSATFGAAVRGFTQHFGLARVNAFGVLPLYHVSGLMAWMRCVMTGGEYRSGVWKEIMSGRLPALPETADGWVLSLVPTQLERLMSEGRSVEWLKRFRLIFVGGGPSWAALREKAESLELPFAPSYGMTEAAAMVAALRPGGLPADVNTYGTPLPHARIDFDRQGMISITSEAVFHGYYPEFDDDRTFYSEDFGEFDFLGRVRVLGRRDGVIITGGEKVQPSEVESVLMSSREFSDLVVLGAPHREWGQQVVAAYAGDARRPNWARVERALKSQLAPHKRPKRFIPLNPWPRTAHGKINRSEITRQVLVHFAQGADGGRAG